MSTIELYKKLICEMIMEMDCERFVRQIYGIIYRERERNWRSKNANS